MKSSLVLKNSFINLSTQIIPILIAIIFIPISIKLLGNEQFGIYSLIITLIVIFNYINFGIAPATTKEVSKYIALNENSKVNSLIINSFVIMCSIGLICLLTLFLFSNDIAILLTKNNLELSIITAKLLKILGYMSPFIMLVIFFRSILEAKQQFLITSLNRALLNSFIFISPSILYLNKNFTLVQVFWFLFLIYFISVIILLHFTIKNFNIQLKDFTIQHSKSLVSIGIWMMISSISGIGLYYADRYFIAILVSAIAVAYYVASYDLVTRLNIISGSLTSALFPAFSHWYETKEYDKIVKNIIFVSKLIVILVSIIGFLIIIFAKLFLLYWINLEYSQNSSTIMQILVIDVLFNTLSVVPFRALSAIGYHKFVAKLYLIETPIYLLILYIFLKEFGLIGAVIAYNIRAFLEMFILYLFLISERVGLPFTIVTNKIISFVLIEISFFVAAFLLERLELQMRIFLLIVILILYLYSIYKIIISSEDKSMALKLVQRFSI